MKRVVLAAQVMLAKLTQHDEKTVDVYKRTAAEWWKTLGPGARAGSQRWLDEHRARLVWSAEAGAFVAR